MSHEQGCGQGVRRRPINDSGRIRSMVAPRGWMCLAEGRPAALGLGVGVDSPRTHCGNSELLGSRTTTRARCPASHPVTRGLVRPDAHQEKCTFLLDPSSRFCRVNTCQLREHVHQLITLGLGCTGLCAVGTSLPKPLFPFCSSQGQWVPHEMS